MMMMMILLLICLSILGDGCCWVVNLHSTGCLQKLSQQQASSSQSLLLLSKTQESKFPKTQILSLSLSLSLSDTDYSSLIHFQNNFKASEASPKHHNFPRQQKDYQQKLQKLSLSLSQLNSTLKNSLSQLSFSQLSVCVCVFCLANAKRDSRKNPKDKIRERQKRETTPIGCNALL
jgi:hypothetical protein